MPSPGPNPYGDSYVKLYYHSDRLGTTDYMTSNTDGRIISYVSYDDWGAPTAKAVLKAGVRELDMAIDYMGHVYDQALGLYYAKTRMYSAEHRRFLSVDAA